MRAISRIFTVLFVASAIHAADWPAFMGENRSGVSPEKGLARTWPEAGPKVLWTMDVGSGFAGAAVRDGQVFVLDRPDDQRDVLRCLDLATGRELWTFAYDAPGKLSYNGSRNVPTVDEKHVITVGPFGHVHCIDRQTHRPVWSHHLVNDFKDPAIDTDLPPKNRLDKLSRAQVPEWGLTQSPVIHDGLVILAPQAQKVGLVAYEKVTGKVRWTSPYIGRNWYSHVSPQLYQLLGVEQVIMLAQPSDPEKSPAKAPPATITAIDPRTGEVLWKTQTPKPYKIPISQPLRIADDRLFITGGYSLGGLILKVSRDDGRWSSEFVVQSRNACAHIHSPILYEGHIYSESFRDHGAAATGMVCLDLEGGLKWQSGVQQQFQSGGYLIADGLLFILNGKTGELTLAEASPAAWKPLATAKVLPAEGGTAWAPLALSDGRLIVRDQHQMRCLDVRRP